MKPRRHTKIIATLGPACDEPGVLEQVLAGGVDLVRVNLSHGVHADHERRILRTRAFASERLCSIGILLDLQGPKIRILRFQTGSIQLESGQPFILDINLSEDAGHSGAVGVDYKALPGDVRPNDTLLLDDGLIVLRVENVQNQEIHCCVVSGGRLSNHKGINRLGGGLSAPALTEKDKEDIQFAARMQADYVAVSFPRCAADMLEARALLSQAGSTARVVAKIERIEAIEALDEIIHSADAVMVARGDLGVELGFAGLPSLQKQIIQRSRELKKAVVTATQMMESMIHQPIPTRAEVSDVANAVLDGTDAVMLSAETASGAYPEKVVATMAEICLAAEHSLMTLQPAPGSPPHLSQRVDEAIAWSAVYTAHQLPVKAIVALTESGTTPLWMSRLQSRLPIYGLTRHPHAQGRMTLFRGVHPIYFDITQFRADQVIDAAVHRLVRLGYLQTADRVVVTRGDAVGGGINSLTIVTVDAARHEGSVSRIEEFNAR